VVALTFDDGWNAADTARILRILERSKVNATFFPIGRAILHAPDVWKSIVAAGFPIGDHTYDHLGLKSRCYQAQLAELTRQQSVCRRILGVDPMPFMRPPYGTFDRVTRLAATGAGEGAIVGWDVDTRDWTGLSPTAIAARALAGTNGSIVLMHTFVDNTPRALARIIAGYRARGFQFVTVGQLLGIPGPVPFP
jgi:peptidoglycan/xylan/chitin deacetylase (PgdA/CDA1 family)